MVLIAIGTAVMGFTVFFLLHIYQNKNEEIFRTLIEENLTSTHKGQASDIRGIIRDSDAPPACRIYAPDPSYPLQIHIFRSDLPR